MPDISTQTLINDSCEFWPLVPWEAQLARGKKQICNWSNVRLCTCSTLDDGPIKLTGFSSGDKFWLLLQDFVASKVFQTLSHNKCIPCLKIRFNNDLRWFILIISYPSQIPNHICCNSWENFMIALIKKREVISKKALSVLLLVLKYQNFEIRFKKDQPIQTKIAAVHKILSATKKFWNDEVPCFSDFPPSIFLLNLMSNWNLCIVYSMIMLNFSGKMNRKYCFNK